MIKTFASEETEALFHGWVRQIQGLPQTIWSVSSRKLDMLNAASELRDLFSPPGNRLEKLRGKLDNYYSIRINNQYRIVFQFHDGNAYEVRITDYH